MGRFYQSRSHLCPQLRSSIVEFRLMRSLCFNSTEEEDGIYCEGSKDFMKWRVFFSQPGWFPRYNSAYFPQIRTLIKQIKEYGVDEDDLFHEDDLMERANIPRVCKCLKEIAIIVSILWSRRKLAGQTEEENISLCPWTLVIIILTIAVIFAGTKWVRGGGGQPSSVKCKMLTVFSLMIRITFPR